MNNKELLEILEIYRKPSSIALLDDSTAKRLKEEREAIYYKYVNKDISKMREEMNKVFEKYKDIKDNLKDPIVPLGEKTMPLEEFQNLVYNSLRKGSDTILKKQRDLDVELIKVTISSGIVLDGDELSQTRMSRAISILDTIDSITWIDSYGTPQNLLRSDLVEALKLAGEKQTGIFIQYSKDNIQGDNINV